MSYKIYVKMYNLVPILIENGYLNKVFNCKDVREIFTKNKYKAIANCLLRCRQREEIICVAQNYNIISDRYRDSPIDKFIIGKQIQSGSILSYEGALYKCGFLNKIPSNICFFMPGVRFKPKSYQTPFGEFKYIGRQTLKNNPYELFTEKDGIQCALPAQALVDIMYRIKISDRNKSPESYLYNIGMTDDNISSLVEYLKNHPDELKKACDFYYFSDKYGRLPEYFKSLIKIIEYKKRSKNEQRNHS